MPDLNPKPDEFKPGQRQLSAKDLNDVSGALIREIRGDGKTIEVNKFGQRIVISAIDKVVPATSTVQVRSFVVRVIRNDYLVCIPFTFQEGVPQPHDSTLSASATNFICVAKPRLLQRTPFHGLTVLLDGVSVTYTYQTTVGRRQANTGSWQEFQRIVPPYFVGDIISARKGTTGVTTTVADGSSSVQWSDVNEAGRAWAAEVTVDEEDS